MNAKLTRSAAVLAFVIGTMAIVAGGQVVLGGVKDYYVIDWLPIYNLIAGLASAFFTAVVIWQGRKIALPAAIATLTSHAAVFIILLTAYGDVVASDSIRAMIIRMSAWLIILILMGLSARRGGEEAGSGRRDPGS